MIGELEASARAIPTRCCMPPDNWCGYWYSLPSRPTRAIHFLASASNSSILWPRTESAIPAFSRTVLCGSSANFWNTIDMRSLRRLRNWSSSNASTFSPSTAISPPVGSINRLRCRMSVDLPDPDSPMMTVTWPSRISTLIS
ncbi:hypothetical protein MELB17_04997 [Marinobacter sp. ELB17]|nr:hypothetical protein MELB17_04997 [Marinobacter sp. ELB17]